MPPTLKKLLSEDLNNALINMPSIKIAIMIDAIKSNPDNASDILAIQSPLHYDAEYPFLPRYKNLSL